jgi:hypothetical protein
MHIQNNTGLTLGIYFLCSLVAMNPSSHHNRVQLCSILIVTLQSKVLLDKLIVDQLLPKFPKFIELEISQEPTAGPYSE